MDMLLFTFLLTFWRSYSGQEGYARRQEVYGGEIKFRPFSLGTSHWLVPRALEPSPRTNFSAKSWRKSGILGSFGLTSLHPPAPNRAAGLRTETFRMHCVYLEDNDTRLHYFRIYVCSQARQAGACANSASQSPPADQARVSFSFSRGVG